MNVQEYLKTKTLDQLHDELAITVNRHEFLPLVILNYDQIESPKTHPIVRECRALVLNTEDNSVVARSFNRFYNWGEVANEMDDFDWNTAETTEKVDGSLVLFYHFDGEWRVNTRGSFANGPMFNSWQANYHKLPQDFTWKQGILRAMGVENLSELNLDPKITYVCEFCSLWNKVVRHYETPRIYLLTCFAGEEEVRRPSPFVSLERYSLRSEDEVVQYVKTHPEATFEGCVIKDGDFRRWKVKNPRYLSLHKMRGANGEELYKPANLIPFILDGEEGELLATYPELTECFTNYKNKVNSAYDELNELWEKTRHIENQKEFALSIVSKPFSSVLFTARKMNLELDAVWRKNADGIVKTLFKL